MKNIHDKKDEFADAIGNPIERSCRNCKHSLYLSGLTCGICEIQKANRCKSGKFALGLQSDNPNDQIVQSENNEDFWEWNKSHEPKSSDVSMSDDGITIMEKNIGKGTIVDGRW